MSRKKTIKIFLASSAELKEERDKFRLFISHLNDKLNAQNIYIEIVQWEKFLDKISTTRLQDEYNNALKACDIALCLFFTKVGKFTEEEFNTAYQSFAATGSPKIWTYFKNAPVNTGTITAEINSLLAFKKKLAELGHFYTSYESTADLHIQFRDQLDLILPEMLVVKNKKSIPLSPDDEPKSAPAKATELDAIQLLLEEPTEDNIQKAIAGLYTLTKDTPAGKYMLPLKAEWVQYKEEKLAGTNTQGKLNLLLIRLLEIIKEYKRIKK